MPSEYNTIMAINKNPIIDKKIAIGVLIIAILIFGLIVGWAVLREEKVPSGEIPKEETETERQMRELEGLRKEVPPLTEEETQSQLEELKKFREDVKPLSEEETQKQLEELEKLRPSQ